MQPFEERKRKIKNLSKCWENFELYHLVHYSLSIYSPVGLENILWNKYVIDRGAQISLNTPMDTEKLDISFKRNRAHAPDFIEQSNLCCTAKVCLCLPGERQWTSNILAVTEQGENTLGYNIFKGEVWQLPDKNIWPFRPKKGAWKEWENLFNIKWF